MISPQRSQWQLWTAVALMIYGTVLRVVDHPPNFTPTGAICLLAGMVFPGRVLPWAVPLGLLLISDAFLGFYPMMGVVYGAWGVVILWGRWVRRFSTPGRILLGALGASAWFFLITNFACWLTMPEYSKDWAGLVRCYAAAVPFWRNMILADLTFTTLLYHVLAVQGELFGTPQTASGKSA